MRRPWYLRKLVLVAFGVVATLSTASCTMILHHLKHGFVSAPPESEFGLGPRAGHSRLLHATIIPAKPLTVGPLQTIHLQLTDSTGAPITDARVAVDGGMPQHGHGLPTKPRVISSDSNGVYVVQGVRFNMGGWWELKFAVRGSAVADSVTFNIRL